MNYKLNPIITKKVVVLLNDFQHKYDDSYSQLVWLAILLVVFSINDAVITANVTYKAYKNGSMVAVGSEIY